MVQAHVAPSAPAAEDAVAFADAALALAGHEVTDSALRAIIAKVARHEITGDEAVDAIRQHVQG